MTFRERSNSLYDEALSVIREYISVHGKYNAFIQEHKHTIVQDENGEMFTVFYIDENNSVRLTMRTINVLDIADEIQSLKQTR